MGREPEEKRDPIRARTALVRAGLRVGGVGWEDGDEEDGERFRMRPIPWRRWEAYSAALLVGVFAIGFSAWVLGRVASPAGWVYWVCLPIGWVGVFAGLQVVMVGGALLVSMVRKLAPGWEVSEAGGATVAVLGSLTAAAVWMCWCGGTAGWVSGMIWLVPAGMNAAAWVLEKLMGEK